MGQFCLCAESPRLETDPLWTCASDTFPAPVSFAAEICFGLRSAYPAGWIFLLYGFISMAGGGET